VPGGIVGIRSRDGGGGGGRVPIPGSAPLDGNAAFIMTGADNPAYDGVRARGGGSGGTVIDAERSGVPTGGGGALCMPTGGGGAVCVSATGGGGAVGMPTGGGWLGGSVDPAGSGAGPAVEPSVAPSFAIFRSTSFRGRGAGGPELEVDMSASCERLRA
jgi:hypothetical protein